MENERHASNYSTTRWFRASCLPRTPQCPCYGSICCLWWQFATPRLHCAAWSVERREDARCDLRLSVRILYLLTLVTINGWRQNWTEWRRGFWSAPTEPRLDHQGSFIRLAFLYTSFVSSWPVKKLAQLADVPTLCTWGCKDRVFVLFRS